MSSGGKKGRREITISKARSVHDVAQALGTDLFRRAWGHIAERVDRSRESQLAAIAERGDQSTIPDADAISAVTIALLHLGSAAFLEYVEDIR